MDLRNPVLRWGIGLMSGAIVAGIGYVFLDGDLQSIAYLVAIIDVLTTPFILKYAIR